MGLRLRSACPRSCPRFRIRSAPCLGFESRLQYRPRCRPADLAGGGARGQPPDGVTGHGNRPPCRRAAAQRFHRSPVCGGRPRGHLRRVGRLRSRRRLRRAPPRRRRLGPRPAPGGPRELGRREELRRLALRGDRRRLPPADRGRVGVRGAAPAPPPRSIPVPPSPPTRRTTTASARPTDPASAASTGRRPPQRDRSRRTPSGCTTCTATWPSWVGVPGRRCSVAATDRGLRVAQFRRRNN